MPAYFDDAQRTATKEAGQIAGLEVLRIINEPTAAALAYGLDKEGTDQTILVFDLGGGTFDVSVLEIGDGVFEVKSTHGDTHLGGDDWDQRVIDWLVDDVQGRPRRRPRRNDKHGRAAPQGGGREGQDRAVRRCSRPRSTCRSSPPRADGPLHLDEQLTRAKFQELTADLLERCRGPFEQAIKDAGLDQGRDRPRDPRRRLHPHARRRRSWCSELTGKEPHKGVNPDEVVAVGAADPGRRAQGRGQGRPAARRHAAVARHRDQGRRHDQAHRAQHHHPDHAAPRCSPPPRTSSRRSRSTCCRASARWRTYNKTLGKFQLVDLPPAPRGVPQIEVTFDIDANGIVHVSAKDRATGKEQSMTITGQSSLDKDDIDQMVHDAEAHAEEDRQRREEAEVRNNADTLVYQTEKLLQGAGRQGRGRREGDGRGARSPTLKDALAGTDVEAIKPATEALMTASQELRAEALRGGVAADARAAGTAAPAGPARRRAADDDEVVDAEIVDERRAADVTTDRRARRDEPTSAAAADVGDDAERRRRRGGRRRGRPSRTTSRRARAASATSTSTRSRSGCRPTSRTTASGSLRQQTEHRRARRRGAGREAAAGARRVRARARRPRRRRACARASSSCTRSCSACSRRRASSASTRRRAVRPERARGRDARADGDGEPIVVEVLRTGYRWKGRVLRPAMVKVDEVRTPMAPQREWFEKDYYKVLGVPETATEKEITRAYRKLAKQYHPDANPGDADGRGAVQGDLRRLRRARRREKRKEYDEVRQHGPGRRRLRRSGGGAGGPGGRRRSPFDDVDDLGDLLGGLFDRGGGGRRGGAAAAAPGPQRGDDLETELHLAFDDAVHGVTTTVNLTSDAACHTCHGTGAEPGTTPAVVPDVRRPRRASTRTRASSRSASRARTCGGRGVDHRRPVPAPATARGIERRPREVKVRIPAGVEDGQRIRLKGRGGAGRNGGPPGDLYVVVHVAPAPAVRAHGASDLTLTVPVTFPEAALGAEVTVPTLDGPGHAQGPGRARSPAARSGCKGRGVADRQGRAGDLLVTVEVAVPDEADRRASARRVEALAAALTDESPRAHLPVSA